MTAFSDISDVLLSMPPPLPGRSRFVLVGDSAKKALAVEMNGENPTAFKDKAGRQIAAIIETDTFRGWEIVDRPAMVKGG